MKLPDMIKIRQHFDKTRLEDVESEVFKGLSGLGLKLPGGSRIAITAGSRGIDNIALVMKAVADFVKSCGAIPFIVPAMGSHGGADAGGQTEVLRRLGITEAFTGAPILSSQETIVIGSFDPEPYMDKDFPEGSISGNSGSNGAGCREAGRAVFPVHVDRYAFESDGVIVVNRVKPHTSFHSDVESGMLKMLAIGLGKDAQAANIHALGTQGLKSLIAPAARAVLSTGKIIAGLGIIENAYDRVREIKAFLPGEIEAGEKGLLAKARLMMPRLPVEDLDVLVVDEIGKNISGTGMDTNIIGRLRIEGEPEPERPRIKRIAVLGLTPETGGNAYGIGLADVTVRELVEKIDYKATYANVLTTTFIERAKIPLVAADDDEALEMALLSCGIRDAGRARIARIRNTLQVEDLYVSDCIYQEIRERVGLAD